MKKEVKNLNLFGQTFESAKQRNEANKGIIRTSKQVFKEFYYSLNELSRGFLEVAKKDMSTALLLLDALKIKVASFHETNVLREVAKVSHKEVLQVMKNNFQKNEENQLVRKVWDIPSKVYHFEVIKEFTLANVYTSIENARNNKVLQVVSSSCWYTKDGDKISSTKVEQMKKEYKLHLQELEQENEKFLKEFEEFKQSKESKESKDK